MAIDATVAVKFAELAPVATVTLFACVMLALLLDSVTASPPPGAAPLSVTVQLEEPGAFTLDGAQERLPSVTPVGWTTVIVPLVVDEEIVFPFMSDATTPLRVIGMMLVLPLEIVKVAEATGPFASGFVSMPKRIQVVELAPLKQFKLFWLAITVTPATCAG